MKINSTYSPLALLLSLVLLLSLSQCRCKDEKKPCQDPTNINCENYDPCYGKKEVYTHFTVLPGTNGFKEPEWCSLPSCDTLNKASVRFRVPDGNTPNTTYEWRIGTDTTVRTEKAFEISFYSHLQQGNWETHIPVTLTIKRPLDNCLANPADTLVTVTRHLFFTEDQLRFIEDTGTRYKGYFTSHPQQEVILHFFYMDNFRKQRNVAVVVGYPFADTLLTEVIYGCGNFAQYCSDYFNRRAKWWDMSCAHQDLTGYLYYSELYYYHENTNKIRLLREFKHPSGFKRYEFIGERF